MDGKLERTSDVTRATIKIGMQNPAHNISPFVTLERTALWIASCPKLPIRCPNGLGRRKMGSKARTSYQQTTGKPLLFEIPASVMTVFAHEPEAMQREWPDVVDRLAGLFCLALSSVLRTQYGSGGVLVAGRFSVVGRIVREFVTAKSLGGGTAQEAA